MSILLKTVMALALAVPAAAAADIDALYTVQPGESIQGAINQALVDSQPSPAFHLAVIRIAPGTYAESLSVQFAPAFSGMFLELEPMGKGQVVVEPADNAPALMLDSSFGAHGNVTLRRLTLRGGIPHGVVAEPDPAATVRLTLEKCRLESAFFDAVHATDGVHLEMMKCTVVSPKRHGVLADVAGVQSTLLIEKCTFEDVGSNAIDVTSDYVVEILKNKLMWDPGSPGGAGIRVRSELPSIVEKNVVKRAGGISIDVASGTSDVVPYNGTSGRMSSNKIMFPAGDAVRLDGDGHVVEKNKLTKAGGDGFVLVGVGSYALTKNSVKTVDGTGFLVQAPDNTFTSNAVSKPGVYGFRVETSGNSGDKNKVKKPAAGAWGLSDAGGGNTWGPKNKWTPEDRAP